MMRPRAEEGTHTTVSASWSEVESEVLDSSEEVPNGSQDLDSEMDSSGESDREDSEFSDTWDDEELACLSSDV